jgi:glycosyltransferase involved in cell wall biosynthesis
MRYRDDMAKIVTVYKMWRKNLELTDMSFIRWVKISEALARCGHAVDIATNEFMRMGWYRKKLKPPIFFERNLRKVPLTNIKWNDYDVVKILFHTGFEILETYGGKDHPFIISKLGSVVGPEDMDGIYFYGKRRKQLYSTQIKINQTSKYITVLSKSAKELWTTCFGPRDNILIVPGGVDRTVPPPSRDPYPRKNETRCIFAGNIYNKIVQPEANASLVDKLNKLGKFLRNRGVRLYMLGTGDIRQLDQRYVNYLGVVPYEKTWDYFYFAHIGIVVVAGKFMHNNESSKIYHYLRAGLPVVSEAGFPNDHVITESKLGFVVENGNLDLMAEKVEEATHKDWERDYAINYILENHTWDKRVEIYDKIIRGQT